MRIFRCPRCGDPHEDVKWRELFRMQVDDDGQRWTHWQACPVNGEPLVMARLRDSGVPERVCHPHWYPPNIRST